MLLPDSPPGQAAAEVVVVDRRRVQLGDLGQRGLDDRRGQVVGTELGERALVGAADGGAGGGDDDGFRHVPTLDENRFHRDVGAVTPPGVERVHDQGQGGGQEAHGVRAAASAGLPPGARRTTPRAPRPARAPSSLGAGDIRPPTTPTRRVREAVRASATAGLREASSERSSLAVISSRSSSQRSNSARVSATAMLLVARALDQLGGERVHVGGQRRRRRTRSRRSGAPAGCGSTPSRCPRAARRGGRRPGGSCRAAPRRPSRAPRPRAARGGAGSSPGRALGGCDGRHAT